MTRRKSDIQLDPKAGLLKQQEAAKFLNMSPSTFVKYRGDSRFQRVVHEPIRNWFSKVSLIKFRDGAVYDRFD